MSSTGGGIVVRHNSLKITGSVDDLKALASSTTDEGLKAAIADAVPPAAPPPDPGEPDGE
jgi:hypothetical protein